MKEGTEVFLVGAERSGTTMLRLMLTHHPDIYFHHEFVYSVEKISSSGELPSPSVFFEYLKLDRIFLEDGLNILDSKSYVEIVRNFLTQLHSRHPNKRIIGATVHRNFNFLAKIWPNSKYIHLVRDPRDVAPSYVKKGWSGHVWDAADVWKTVEETWASFANTLLPNQHITIKYENLVLSPQYELERICLFLGIEYSGEMLEYVRESTFSSPDKGLVSQWKERPSKEAKYIESKLSNIMAKNGYELSGELVKVGFLLNYFLYSISRFKKFIFSVRRYGALLRGLDFISRRVIPNKRFRGHVKSKMNLINAKHVK